MRISTVSKPLAFLGLLLLSGGLLFGGSNAGQGNVIPYASGAPDFLLSAAPNSLTIVTGAVGESTIIVTSVNGFSGTVILATTPSPLCPSPYCTVWSLYPDRLTLVAGGIANSTLTILAGQPATGQLPVVATSGPLSHSVSVTFTIIPVQSRILAAFTYNPCVMCAVAGDAVFFNANYSTSLSGSIASYLWNFGDGSPAVKTADPETTHIYFDASGKWLVALTVTDSLGETATISQQVVFDIAPRFNFSPLKPTVNELVGFNGSESFSLGGPIESFDWSFGDGSLGMGKLVNHFYPMAGIYRVTLMLVVGADGPSVSKTIVVTNLTGLNVQVKTDKQLYAPGEPVQITIVLSNNAASTITLHFGTSCQASFQIIDRTGMIVYDYSRHVACLMVLTEVVLNLGQSVSYNFVWNQVDDSGRQVDAGTYSVKGLFASSEPTPIGLTTIAIGLLMVGIDVKPGNDLNRVNTKSGGTVPVAILSDPSFDSSQVDPSTVRFGRTGTEASPTSSSTTDVNNDGLLDLLLRFNIQDTGFRAGDTLGVLTGQTFGGKAFTGSDHIQAFLPGDVNNDLSVTILDAALLAFSYDAAEGSSKWNLYADFDENQRIDILDAAVLGLYYGQNA